MSCDEIRYWIRELRVNHGWRTHALSRVLAAYDMPTLLGKLRGNWIYPSEQARFTRQLDRILSGELVCLKTGNRYDAALADFPQPIERKARLVYDFETNRVRWVQPRCAVQPTLPSMGHAFANLVVWDPK